jgi:hypothetical protein
MKLSRKVVVQFDLHLYICFTSRFNTIIYLTIFDCNSLIVYILFEKKTMLWLIFKFLFDCLSHFFGLLLKRKIK